MSRPAGSKNAHHRAVHCPSGGATSASKVARLVGVAERYTRVFVRGEGWVLWSEIERQVAAAFTLWRQRKALSGIYITSGADDYRAHIAEAVAHRKGHA